MESWEMITNPTILRENLMGASIYISAYEMCREFVIGKPKDFFTDNWGCDGEKITDEYFEEVLSFDKSPLKASLLWFKAQNAINEQDINSFNEAREHRNKIAHNLPMFISDPAHKVDDDIFNEMLEITHKIGVFWVIHYELGINPDNNTHGIKENDIQIGTIMMINMIRKIAFGHEPEEGHFYQELKRRMTPKS